MDCFKSFFNQNVALYYALFLAVVTFSTLESSPLLLIFLFPLLFLFKTRAILALTLSFFYFLLINFTTSPKFEFDENTPQDFYITIDDISLKRGSFGKFYQYRGKIAESNNFFLQKTPFVFFLRENIKERPIAGSDYILKGTFQTYKGKTALIKPITFQTVDETFSFAEMRFQAKQWVKSYLVDHFKNEKSKALLTALLIGEMDDKDLLQTFSHLGLIHLLAISGFHFSLLASALLFILKPFFPPKVAKSLLLLILSSYFFFLGAAPSILRAFMTIFITFYGTLLERKGESINCLGIAFLASLLIDPYLIYNIGFQFSFLATLAILLLQMPLNELLNRFSPKRDLKIIEDFPFSHKIYYLLLNLFKDSLSISLAVFVVAFPLTLFYFGQFPLIGIIYNLFFPALISLSMTFFIFALLSTPIQPISSLFYSLSDHFTEVLIKTTDEIPLFWQKKLISPEFSWFFLALVLIFVYSFAIKFYSIPINKRF